MHGRFSLLRDGITWVWLAIAATVALVHRWVPSAVWVMLHLVVLGALTHAVMVWSRHFAHALLRARPDVAADKRHSIRLIALLIGAAGVIASVPLGYWHVTATFATAVAASVLWHGFELWRLLRRSLPGRFRVTLWYYLTACLCLPVGATCGGFLASGLNSTWHWRVLVAHVCAMLLGWVLLTVVGTLVTFWPTILRVRMDERAERFAQQAYPWLLAGVVLSITAALLGDALGVGIALLVYAFGIAWWARGLVVPLLRRVPREFAPASVAASLVWLLVALLWLGALLVIHGRHGVAAGLGDLLAVIAGGFAAQLLTGAMSYLIPSVRGGGPSVVRAGQRELNKLSSWRIVTINLGLALWLILKVSWVRVTLSSVVLLALLCWLILVVRAVAASAREAKRKAANLPPQTVGEGIETVWTRRGVLGGLATLTSASAIGVAIDPQAAGLPAWPQAQPPVTPTGRTTTVEVYTQQMRFHPETVEVPRGDLLKVVLTNRDEVDSHDLRIGTVQTSRLDPGNSTELTYGPVGQSVEGYCTIVGHRQLGMVFKVIAT